MVLQETKVRLSKAVLLRDAFTGEAVSAGIRIRSLSGGKTEKRSGGYFLFLDVENPEFEIEVDSPVYQHRKLCLKTDNGEGLEEIRMYPSSAYPMRAGCTAVRGRADPGSLLRFYIEDERGSCRLLSDYKKGEEQISFYIKSGIWGASWHIGQNKEKTGEYFDMGHGDTDTGVYPLNQPLNASYKKKDTLIYPAWESIADEKGEFYLLLGDILKERCMLKYSCRKMGEEISGEAEILRAKENRILED